MVALRPVFVMHLCSRASRGCGPLEAPLGLEDQPPLSPLPGLVGQCWPTVGGGAPFLCRRATLQGCLRVLGTPWPVPASQRAKRAQSRSQNVVT